MKFKIDENLPDELVADIVRRACEEPAHQIAGIASFEGAVVTEKIRSNKDNYGFNAASGNYQDLVAGGVIDRPR